MSSPHRTPHRSEGTGYGQVIEYVENRLYLAAYTHPPSENTPFPYPTTAPSLRKRTPQAQSRPVAVTPPLYFSVDDTLLYNRFHADFGPFHVGHCYRFSIMLHNLMSDPNYASRSLVFWSKADAKSRTNAACLLACYMVLVQSWSPHMALAPIAQADPPYMSFRDAGYSQADYGLSIQDVVYGVWKAKQESLVDAQGFNLEEYERYERVDMGDFNWITPRFIAFASPQHEPVAVVPDGTPEYLSLPRSIDEIAASESIPESFKNVLMHFKERNVGLVVRLNSELYSPSYFTALGIEHIDMIFDDGTCPPLPLVRKFIKIAHGILKQKRNIAVHCKAGLGRTGCLIGAYLIYRYGFTANELIAFMRFMRPGMVVGPQQHWLHINQGSFRQWWWEDRFKQKLAQALPSTPTKSLRTSARASSPVAAQNVTPPPPASSNKRSALGEIDSNEAQNAASPSARDEQHLPAPTPGQPRKTGRKASGLGALGASAAGNQRSKSSSHGLADSSSQPSSEVVEMHAYRHSKGLPEGESEEEWQVRRVSRTTAGGNGSSGNGGGGSSSGLGGHRSPATSDAKQKRAHSVTSYTTTTTTTMAQSCSKEDAAHGGAASDLENWAHDAPHVAKVKTPGSSGRKSGSGAGFLAVKGRSSPSREVKGGGVRKTSGRVGSMGSGATAVARLKS